jgi:FtsZ-binding cell division protein ZapB
MALVELNLDGHAPIPRWQLIAIWLLLLGFFGMIASDLAGLVPREATGVVETVDRLEQTVQDIATEQDALRTEQDQMRADMNKGFEEMKKLLEKR